MQSPESEQGRPQLEAVLQHAPINSVPQAVRVLLLQGAAELAANGYTEQGSWMLLNPDQTVWWLEERGAPVAVLTYEAIGSIRKAWLALVYVSPEHRRRGCFRRLLQAARERAHLERLDGVELGTHSKNEVMHFTCRELGMTPTFVRFAAPALPPTRRQA